MTTEGFARAQEIVKEKEQLEKFIAAVELAIIIPTKALPQSLRDKMCADGLPANLDALVKVWVDQKIEQLDAEFAAL